MKVNADFTAPIALRTDDIEWIASPMAGVARRMLDRIGGEVARATSIVRYAPGSAFSQHTHSGGEEFIVLEGVFQDEHGDYPAGTYVRNPIGTHHVPRSDDGCVIFVKLWQFDEDDRAQFSRDMNSLKLEPVVGVKGVSQAVLSERANELVTVQQWDAGTAAPIGDTGGAELLILDGALEFQGETYGRHDWIRLPAGMDAEAKSGPNGTRIWVKTRHLRKVASPQSAPSY
ncbi:MAG: cupin domain-containing protein [Marinomonas sp.]